MSKLNDLEISLYKIERLKQDLERFKRQGLNSRDDRVKYYKAQLRDWQNYRQQLLDLACPKCIQADVELGKVIMGSGEYHVQPRCAVCNRTASRCGPWVKKANIPDEVIEHLPTFEDYRLNNPPCVVCGAVGTELHHWAPRELFGDECETWPQAYLCPTHHQQWHNVVTNPFRQLRKEAQNGKRNSSVGAPLP